MAKINLTDIGSGFNLATAVNANNATLEGAIDNTLSRDGTSPNTMLAVLDMNTHRVINVAEPIDDNDAVRLIDLVEGVATLVDSRVEEIITDAISDAIVVLDATIDDKVYVQLACSNLITNLSVGDTKAYFRSYKAFTIASVRASLVTASSSGTVTLDVRKNGTTIFSTPLTIDATEKTSVTAAVPAVISNASVANDDLIEIDIDGAGTGAKGLVVTFISAT